MVYFRRKKKSTKKKKSKKYARRRSTVPRMGRSLGFPKERIIKLRYVDSCQLTSTLGTLATFKFRANSLYDPNYTGAGHQPFGFDQWATYYNHYQVTGARMTIRAHPNSAMGYPAQIGTYLADDATTSYDWYGFQESGRGSHTIIPAITTDRSFKLTQNFSLKKFFNRVVDPGNTSASVTSDPLEQAFFVIYLQALDTASTTAAVACSVQIDFTARFFEPKDLPTS